MIGRGIGDLTPPVAANCGFDQACIAKNVQASDAYYLAKYIAQYGAAPPDSQGVVVDLSTPGAVPYQPVVTSLQTVTQPPVSKTASFNFGNIRSGSSFYVGDPWSITISGGNPGDKVSCGGGPNGTNVVTQEGVLDASGTFRLTGNYKDTAIGNWYENWMVNGQTVGTATFSVSAVAGGQQGAKVGSFSFATSRGGNSMVVGDTWTITITGASPNTNVLVSGTGPGGSFSGTVEGVTDSVGNFTKSGIPGVSTIGAWQESWSVGGYSFPMLSFTVAPAAVVTQSSVTTGGNVNTGQQATSTGTTNTTAAGGAAAQPTVFGLFGDTSAPITIPGTTMQVDEYTALGIAEALVLGFMFMGGGRR